MEKWAAKKKNKEPEDQFQRLPDDVVLNIFDKLSDIQCLCRCVIVSKRFSSLIPLVQTVSIESKTWNSKYDRKIVPWNSKYDHGGTFPLGYLSASLITNLVFRPLRGLHNRTLFPTSPRDVSGVMFLTRLTHVRALNIELPSAFVGNNDSVFKWGAKFTPNLDSVTFLYASSLSKMMESEQQDESEEEESESESEEEEEEEMETEQEDESEEEEEEEMENWITYRERNRRLLIAIDCIKDAVLWLGILCFVSHGPMLQSVTIIDSKKKGVKLCLSGEKLVECRNTFSMCRMNSLSNMGRSWTLENMKVGYVPVLQLPMSEYVMKGVTIVNYKMFADDDYDASKAMVDAFAEEQDVFSEAVVQIQEKHKDCLTNVLF
ncbi:F-box protein At4g18380-like [Rhododendron vialii]|uniref:F-box protein At4g18380-like n=1 Tax=Rhododendron vialii TaxID=182163 RepID=UPI00265F4A1D|nr:F-box protein At4g18380-like [Rhododendron vialii]XP_058199175.1 F-box protein At4g18380-like [Rhododendron vialii]